MKTCRLFDWKHLWVLLLISLFAVSCGDDYYDGLFEGNKKKLEELLNNSQYAVERIDIRCYVDDAYTQISVDRNAVQLAEHCLVVYYENSKTIYLNYALLVSAQTAPSNGSTDKKMSLILTFTE